MNEELRQRLAESTDSRPLWMPRGSVRAILAIGIVGAAIAAALTSISSDALTALAGAVTVYYFEHRKDQ